MATEKLARQISELEAAVSKLPSEAVENFIKRLQRHSYSVRLDAHHAIRYGIAQSGISCSQAWLVVTCGRDTTNSSGKLVVPLGRLLCGAATDESGTYVPIGLPMVVASTHGGAPAIATSTHTATEVQTDGSFLLSTGGAGLIEGSYLDSLELEIRTWGVDGQPKGGVNVSWICTFEVAQAVSIGG